MAPVPEMERTEPVVALVVRAAEQAAELVPVVVAAPLVLQEYLRLPRSPDLVPELVVPVSKPVLLQELPVRRHHLRVQRSIG